jgi:hypothetical protein
MNSFAAFKKSLIERPNSFLAVARSPFALEILAPIRGKCEADLGSPATGIPAAAAKGGRFFIPKE